MRGEVRRDFTPGDRVVFQYANGSALHGTIVGWTDKYAAYMLHCDTGRKLLVSSAHLRLEPGEDPEIRERRERRWPSYAVYLVMETGTHQIWLGKARTPRLAFERAAQKVPALMGLVGCKDYKRINAKQKYPVGSCGVHAYCEKVPLPSPPCSGGKKRQMGKEDREERAGKNDAPRHRDGAFPEGDCQSGPKGLMRAACP